MSEGCKRGWTSCVRGVSRCGSNLVPAERPRGCDRAEGAQACISYDQLSGPQDGGMAPRSPNRTRSNPSCALLCDSEALRMKLQTLTLDWRKNSIACTRSSTSMPRTLHISSLELYNKLQAQKNWPSGGAPALLDLRPQSKRIIRGAVRASLKDGDGELQPPPHSFANRDVCLYDATPESLEDHPVAQAILKADNGGTLFLLSEPCDAFERPFRTGARASRRPRRQSVRRAHRASCPICSISAICPTRPPCRGSRSSRISPRA